MKKYLSFAILLLVSSVALGVYVEPPYIVPIGGTGRTTFTANLPLLGNGTGALIQGTVSGSTTTLATSSGTLTSGDCVSIDASGNLIDAGAACGTGNGTVTSVSVVSANGLAGTVATSTTTPAITLSTSITGILQGNGTAISAATTTGSGNVVLATSPTLVTPALGTPSAVVLTNGTGLPLTTGVTGVLPVANATIPNVSLGTCATAQTINWALGNSFTLTLTNGDTCALTMSNAASGQTITVSFYQPSSGGGTGAISTSGLLWPNLTTPTITTGNSATDTCTFIYNGTDTRGSCAQAF